MLRRAGDGADADNGVPAFSGRHPRADPARNNFNALRLIAASLVVLSHGIELPTGVAGRDWMSLATGRSFAWYGVNIFFAISGYLIYLSWRRRPSLVAFSGRAFYASCLGCFACLL